MRPLPTFRQLLVLLALGCVLPMAAMALALVAYEYQRDRAQVERGAVATSRALMAAVDDRMEGLERSLHGLVNSPALMTGDLARLHEEALVFARAEHVQAVILVDADGRLLLNTNIAAGAPLADEGAARLPQDGRNRGAMLLDLFRPRGRDGYALGVAVPLPGGRMLEVHVDPAWLRELLLRQKLPPTWIAAVLDRSGRIVARTHDPERFVGTSARAALVARIAEVPEDAVHSVTVDGVPVVSAFSRSDRSGWSVVLGMPTSELTAPLVRSSATLLLGTAAVLLLTLWLAWRLANGLSRSVEALGGAVRAAGHHVTMRLPQPVFQEAHQLGQALLHATAAMEDATESQKRLEDRIHSVLDTAMDGIVTADAHGRIVLFNRAATGMFRLGQDEALGMRVEDLVPSPLREQHRQWREQATPETARQMAPGRLVRAVRSDGSTFEAQASISVTGEGADRLYTAILRPVNWDAH